MTPDPPGPTDGGARRLWIPVVAWAVVAYGMSKVQLAAARHWAPEVTRPFTWQPLLTDTAGRLGWGTGDYWKIATGGYQLGDGLEAAFPGYALAIRYLAEVGGWHLYSVQILLSGGSGLAAAVLLWTWLHRRGLSLRGRVAALAVYLSYPYAFMLYGIGYNDPFLLPFVLATCIWVDEDRPILAGIAAGAATFIRPNALPLIPFLLVWVVVARGAIAVDAERWWDVRRWRPVRGALRRADAGVLLAFVGVGAYAAWLVHHAGRPLYFMEAQGFYRHKPLTDWTTWLKPGVIDARVNTIGSGWLLANHLLSLLVLVAAVVLLPAVVRRLGVAYGVLAAGLLVVAWTGPIGFAPAGRYLLPALGMHALAIGEWSVERPGLLRRAALGSAVVGGLAASVTLTWFFARYGVWLEW